MRYHTKDRRPLQDVLTCIRHGVKLSDAGGVTRATAEHVLLAPGPFEALFDDDQGSVARTREVAERLPDGTRSAQCLRQLPHEGAQRRYGARITLPTTSRGPSAATG